MKKATLSVLLLATCLYHTYGQQAGNKITSTPALESPKSETQASWKNTLLYAPENNSTQQWQNQYARQQALCSTDAGKTDFSTPKITTHSLNENYTHSAISLKHFDHK